MKSRQLVKRNFSRIAAAALAIELFATCAFFKPKPEPPIDSKPKPALISTGQLRRECSRVEQERKTRKDDIAEWSCSLSGIKFKVGDTFLPLGLQSGFPAIIMVGADWCPPCDINFYSLYGHILPNSGIMRLKIGRKIYTVQGRYLSLSDNTPEGNQMDMGLIQERIFEGGPQLPVVFVLTHDGIVAAMGRLIYDNRGFLHPDFIDALDLVCQ